MGATLHKGDCLTVLRRIEANTFHSLITDPPAGIGFMGKSWDGNRGGRDAWIAWLAERMIEANRTLKPGAWGLVWALPRTSHWTGYALEEAGFIVEDRVSHLFGTGFPKNKATQLKPGCEDWWLVRKKRDGSVEENVARWGTGALRTDDCRLETSEIAKVGGARDNWARNGIYGSSFRAGRQTTGSGANDPNGRWPSHVVFSHNEDCEEGECSEGCPVAELDRQSGILKTNPGTARSVHTASKYFGVQTQPGKVLSEGSVGGASRFFYCAKPSKKERDLGLTGEEKPWVQWQTANGTSGKPSSISAGRNTQRRNIHPTVKSLSLMRWLIRLITPQGGTVLDPFMGSGTTLMAAEQEGLDSYGIEAEAEYLDIARMRVKAVCSDVKLLGGVWVPVRR